MLLLLYLDQFLDKRLVRTLVKFGAGDHRLSASTGKGGC